MYVMYVWDIKYKIPDVLELMWALVFLYVKYENVSVQLKILTLVRKAFVCCSVRNHGLTVVT